MIPIYVNIFTLLARETSLFIIYLLFLNANITVLTVIIVSSYSRMTTTIIAIEFFIDLILIYTSIAFIALKKIFLFTLFAFITVITMKIIFFIPFDASIALITMKALFLISYYAHITFITMK
jgi:hypothetical protein